MLPIFENQFGFLLIWERILILHISSTILIFFKSKSDCTPIDLSVFNKTANFYKIAKLQFCDFFNDVGIKSCENLND